MCIRVIWRIENLIECFLINFIIFIIWIRYYIIGICIEYVVGIKLFFDELKLMYEIKILGM